MVKTFLFASPFKPGLLRCLIYLVLEGGHKYTKIGLAMGVTIGGDAAKSGENTHLLVIMGVRLSQKIGYARLDESDSIKKRKRLENTYKKCARLLGNGFNVTYDVYLLRAQKCRPPWGVPPLSARAPCYYSTQYQFIIILQKSPPEKAVVKLER